MVLLHSHIDFPGNKNLRYCNEKEKILTLKSSFEYAIANALLKLAIPPLNGKAGPIIITFFLSNLYFFFYLITVTIM